MVRTLRTQTFEFSGKEKTKNHYKYCQFWMTMKPKMKTSSSKLKV